MDEKIILEVLAEQKEEIAGFDVNNWCPRMEEEQFELDSPLAQVVIGVRRSGQIHSLPQSSITETYPICIRES